MKIRVNQFYDNVDCPREFVCAHCGTSWKERGKNE